MTRITIARASLPRRQQPSTMILLILFLVTVSSSLVDGFILVTRRALPTSHQQRHSPLAYMGTVRSNRGILFRSDQDNNGMTLSSHLSKFRRHETGRQLVAATAVVAATTTKVRPPSALFSISSSSSDDANEKDVQEALDDLSSNYTLFLNKIVGGCTLLGGLIGFLTKGSKASLISGIVFGGGLIKASSQIRSYLDKKTSSTTGYKLGTTLSSVLMYIMGKKYFRSGKYMPAGFIASLSLIAFICNGLDYLVAISPDVDGGGNNSGGNEISDGEGI